MIEPVAIPTNYRILARREIVASGSTMPPRSLDWLPCPCPTTNGSASPLPAH
jgi:hypothetical protein